MTRCENCGSRRRDMAVCPTCRRKPGIWRREEPEAFVPLDVYQKLMSQTGGIVLWPPEDHYAEVRP